MIDRLQISLLLRRSFITHAVIAAFHFLEIYFNHFYAFHGLFSCCFDDLQNVTVSERQISGLFLFLAEAGIRRVERITSSSEEV